MLINSSALLGTSAPPEPLIAAPSPQPGPDFASLLRQTVQAPPPPPPAPMPAQAVAPAVPNPPAAAPPPVPSAQTDSSDTDPATPAPAPSTDTGNPADAALSSTSNASASRAAAKAKPGSAPAPSASKATGANASAEADKPASDKDGAAAATATGIDPNLAQWLAQLHVTAEAARGSGSAADGESLEGDADGSAKALGGKAGADAKTGNDVVGADAGVAANPAADAGVAESALAELQSAARSADSAHRGKLGAVDATAAAMSLAAPATTSSAAPASAPVAVAVATPVDAPDFPQALGVHLAVLAKDGVQHAELHLNPTDMGPVSVQIAVDGTQARIDFGADMAATRHAIEAGLPELAGALRDAGLTLTGGGVSQHARGQGNDSGSGARGDSQGGRAVSGAGGADAATPAARRNVALGGVDLYA